MIDCDDCGFDKGNAIEDNDMIANCDRCGKINDINVERMMFGGC